MPTFADANKKQQQFNLIKTMKRTKKNVMMVARPLNVQERKEIMEHLTDGMEPVGEEEMSQVEINEEFGLAGKMMLALLFQWLNAENRKAMDRLLRFYHPLDKAMLIYAMLLYVTTGKRVRMNNAVAQRHYNLMVEFVDDDMYTLPSHKHLMRLYEKYGLILPINETADGNL